MEAEQNEVIFGMEVEGDGFLPDNAEHFAQPRAPMPRPPAPEDGDPTQAEIEAYLTECGMRVNALGMNIWNSDFPRKEYDDFYWNPRDLPMYWGIEPGELREGLRTDILKRYRKAMLILHPDRHVHAHEAARRGLEATAAMVSHARDLILEYLDLMREGRVRAPPKSQGVYIQELPEEFQDYLQNKAGNMMSQVGPGVKVHSFLQTSDCMYCQPPCDGAEPLDLLAARDFYQELFTPDDLPLDPKQLLLEIVHRYTCMADGGLVGAGLPRVLFGAP